MQGEESSVVALASLVKALVGPGAAAPERTIRNWTKHLDQPVPYFFFFSFLRILANPMPVLNKLGPVASRRVLKIFPRSLSLFTPCCPGLKEGEGGPEVKREEGHKNGMEMDVGEGGADDDELGEEMHEVRAGMGEKEEEEEDNDEEMGDEEDEEEESDDDYHGRSGWGLQDWEGSYTIRCLAASALTNSTEHTLNTDSSGTAALYIENVVEGTMVITLDMLKNEELLGRLLAEVRRPGAHKQLESGRRHVTYQWGWAPEWLFGCVAESLGRVRSTPRRCMAIWTGSTGKLPSLLVAWILAHFT